MDGLTHTLTLRCFSLVRSILQLKSGLCQLLLVASHRDLDLDPFSFLIYLHDVATAALNLTKSKHFISFPAVKHGRSSEKQHVDQVCRERMNI